MSGIERRLSVNFAGGSCLLFGLCGSYRAEPLLALSRIASLASLARVCFLSHSTPAPRLTVACWLWFPVLLLTTNY